jgi:RHS repeat-associated protein
VLERPPSIGDLDGDGLHDALSFFHPNGQANTAFRAGVGMAIGHGFEFSVASGGAGYLDAIAAFSPHGPQADLWGVTVPEDYGFALLDVNADGLADLVRNHANRPSQQGFETSGGGRVLVNTGTTFVDLTGTSEWQVSAGPNKVPTVPDDINVGDGSVFLDLDGDGVTDLLRQPPSPGIGQAWLNKFAPPVIEGFPNQLALPTNVTYVVITTADATTGTAPTYTESGDLDPGTSFANIPLRVVKSVTTNTGAGFKTDTYQYSDLRKSAFDFGPQGFKTMTATDGSGMVTKTTFAQAYPYTGLPIQVERSNQGPVSLTKTFYCTQNQLNALCAGPSESVTPSQHAPRSTFFVRPIFIEDKAYLRTSTFPEGSPTSTTTFTTFRYDVFGNPSLTNVEIQGLGESYTTLTDQEFGTPGSDEQRMGKVTRTRVTTQRSIPAAPPITRTTTFEYRRFFGALALAKKKIEPGADALNDHHTELHTAYEYDRFGNLTTTTSCASDFNNCVVGAEGPAELPFRTTRTSYLVGDFNAPSGPGLVSTLGYGDGRFPVKTTNGLGHAEFSAYDPLLGVLVQKTGPNGIHNCYAHDPLGNQTSDTARCGSANALTTTVQRYLVPGGAQPPCGSATCNVPPALAKAITVTQPPVGSPTWTYTDAVGRTIATRSHHFNGGFVETTVSYDALGRMTSESRPHLLGETAFLSVPTYDPLSRVKLLTQDLGSLDGTSAPASAITTTTFQGATIKTDRVVNGVMQTRSETKNAVGKVVSVVDHDGSEIRYDYDAEGNLTGTLDPNGNALRVTHDVRGRKIASTDPDLGSWTYVYNGFGDLVSQADAKNQTTTMTYDRLGRLRKRTDGTGTAEWVYDLAEGAGIGKLAVMVSAPDPLLNGTCASPHVPGNRAFRSFKYTEFGDIAEENQCVDGVTFVTSYGYDPFGRQNVVRYPTITGQQRLSVEHHYTTLGFLQYTSDLADGSVLWAATNMNALGHVTGETLKNGVETTSLRNPSTGWLIHSDSVAHADGNRVIQRWDHAYDEAGNLLRRNRSDAVTVATTQETFTYDPLNRVKTARTTTSDGLNATESFFYDKLGNITQKSGKTYTYNSGCTAGTRPAGPHAVCNVTGGGAFTYDGNGNMLTGGSRTVSYNPANKPTHIERSGSAPASADFVYDGSGNRIVQIARAGGTTSRTIYIGLGATGKSLYERTTRTGNVQEVEHVQFIYAQAAHGRGAFALRIATQTGSTTTTTAKYHHYDHLGSVTAMSDERGRVIGGNGANATVMNYDAWGTRRRPDGRPATIVLNQQPGRREFTGHETISGIGLVNMNGRVYDPALGRFLSADPNIQFVSDLQSYNRYSYVLNNPLRYTDPTGYWTFVGGWFDQLVNYTLAGVGIAACAGSGGVGCAVGFTLLTTAYNVASAVQSNAGFSQIATILTLSAASGALGGAFGGAVTQGWTNQLAAQITGGAISGMVSAVIMTPVTDRNFDHFGRNILIGAGTGAATAAATYWLKTQVAASQASALEAQGAEASVVPGHGGGAPNESDEVTHAKEAGRSGSVASQLAGAQPNAKRAMLYDSDPQRGAALARRVRQELVGPLAGKYRVVFVNRTAAPGDVAGLGPGNVMIAILGRGGEARTMELFDASGVNFDRASVKAAVAAKFSGAGGGITLGRIATVPVHALAPFGGEDVLVGNITTHEFGHSISTHSAAWDHSTGGVMSPNIGTSDPILHFTPMFLSQF